MVCYALDALRACREVIEIVLSVAREDVERARRTLLHPAEGRSERVVAGGADRGASVAAALAEVSAACDLVVVHDAARPFIRPSLVSQCLEAAAVHGAAIAALPSTDTVKEVGADGVVAATLDRTRLWLVQTPQAFRRELLIEAYAAAGREAVTVTDDAALVERLGRRVHVVRGDPQNTKITWPEDVTQSEQLVSGYRADAARGTAFRSGIGYDAHGFAQGRPLVLAGVRLRDDRGLLGHSDADVVCHAIADAVLGAAGSGDIGQHFPDSDPRYAGISSLSLLAEVSHMVRRAGWEIENVDAVVIAEEPRIAPFVPDMRKALSGAMDIDRDRVNLKGKSTEGMGFTGRGEGIASQAIAVLRSAHHTRSGAKSEE